MYLIVHVAGIVSLGFGLAMNRQRPIFFVQLGASVGALAMSVVLVRALGLHGVAWGLLVAQALGTAVLMRVNCRWIGQQAGQFLLDVIGRGIPAFAFAVAGGGGGVRPLFSFPGPLVVLVHPPSHPARGGGLAAESPCGVPT